jgi:hypothetical protein
VFWTRRIDAYSGCEAALTLLRRHQDFTDLCRRSVFAERIALVNTFRGIATNGGQLGVRFALLYLPLSKPR